MPGSSSLSAEEGGTLLSDVNSGLEDEPLAAIAGLVRAELTRKCARVLDAERKF